MCRFVSVFPFSFSSSSCASSSVSSFCLDKCFSIASSSAASSSASSFCLEKRSSIPSSASYFGLDRRFSIPLSVLHFALKTHLNSFIGCCFFLFAFVFVFVALFFFFRPRVGVVAYVRALPAVVSSSSVLLLRRILLMNLHHGSLSAPIQSNYHNNAAAEAARIHSLSDGAVIQHNRNAQQFLGSGSEIGGGGGVGGGRRLSSGGGGNDGAEVNSHRNLEQVQQQQDQQLGIRRGRGDGEHRWRERQVGSHYNGNNKGWEEEAPSSLAGGATAAGQGWWGGREGKKGEGKVFSRGRAGRGDWNDQVKSKDWERWPRKSKNWERWPRRAEFGSRDGRFVRSHKDEERYWCSAENELPAAAHEKFVLVSYNVLADKNVLEHYNEMYYHRPYWLMSWDRRKTKLVEELACFSPDFMCLQEVDKYEDLHQEFQRMGYRGAYKGRTNGARDGCAMFWKPTRFCLLEETGIQFKELNLRDNVAQLCVFQSIAGTAGQDLNSESKDTSLRYKRGPGNLVIVGNIHVLFNPKRGDVKLGQVRVLLESAYALSQKYGGAPVTIAGDFNSTPNSDLYKFLASSELDISCLNRATISGQVTAADGSPIASISQESAGGDSPHNFMKKRHWTREELRAATGTFESTALRHKLNLRSAYSQIKGEDGCRDGQGEPLVTTFHKKFMGTVDYIWHTEGIDTVKVLDTVPVNVLQRTGGLPSKKWGSDHLALACELAFLPNFEPNLP